MAAYKKYFSFIVLLITTVLLTLIIFKDIFETRNSEIEQLKNEIVALNEDKQSRIAALIKATETYSVNEIIYNDRVEIFNSKGW